MGPWKKWMNEDVVYIITDEEKQAFKRLKTDEERQQFVEQFWLRRDPTPDTEENEYKEEHYRRIAYANDHYLEDIKLLDVAEAMGVSYHHLSHTFAIVHRPSPESN